jgi:uncharacterized protein
MSSSGNKQIVQHIFEELGNGNSAPLIESLAEDFRFTVMGTTKWSRLYDGKATVLTELFAPLRAKMAGPIRNRPIRILAEGKAYNNAYCNVIRLEGGKLKELVEYCDTALVNAVLGDPAETKAAAR